MIENVSVDEGYFRGWGKHNVLQPHLSGAPHFPHCHHSENIYSCFQVPANIHKNSVWLKDDDGGNE